MTVSNEWTVKFSCPSCEMEGTAVFAHRKIIVDHPIAGANVAKISDGFRAFEISPELSGLPVECTKCGVQAERNYLHLSPAAENA